MKRVFHTICCGAKKAFLVFFLLNFVFSPVFDNILLGANFSAPLAAGVAEAAFNQQINYQGKLTDTSNVSVSNGSYNMEFALYTARTGGSPIWTETWCKGSACSGTGDDNRITVSNGLFSVMLGSTTPLTNVDFNQPLYLSINIGGSANTPTWDGEMSPRKILGAVPAAFEAKHLNGLNDTQFLRTDTSNATSTASTFITLTQSGAGNILNLVGQSSASVFTVLSSGNIGIGTTSPGQKLSVAGDILGNNFIGSYFVATTSTASLFPYASTTALTVAGTNGLQLTTDLNGPLQVNGGLVSATTSIGVLYGGTGLTSVASSSILIGTGGNSLLAVATSSLGLLGTHVTSVLTPNYISKWEGSAFSNSLLYDTGTKVGIGTTSPGQLLSIDGNGLFNGTLTSFGVHTAPYFIATSTDTASVLPYASTTAFTASGLGTFGTLGVGSTSPSTTFGVVGSAYITTGLGVGKLNTAANSIDVANTGSYRFNATRVLVASTTLSNYFFAGSNPTGLNTTATGSNNIGIGGSTFTGITSGANNIALGVGAMQLETTGQFNIALGGAALQYNTTSDKNTAVGYNALNGSGSNPGGENTALGYNAAVSSNTGTNNTVVGSRAGAQLTTGSSNTMLGQLSGGLVTTGSNNVLIGASTLTVNANDSYYMNIANIIYGTSTTNAATNQIGIGTSTPSARFAVKAISTGTGRLFALSDSANSEKVTILDNGKVGIGTTSPGSIFSIGSLANFTTATTTFYGSGGINMAGGCFAVNGTCVSGSGGISLSVANTWTALQTFSANASTTQIGSTGSAYFATISGNVGIGTTSPGQKLSVAGDILGNNFIGSYFTATSTATSTFIGGLSASLLNISSTTASSTFANGINLTAGCFAVNGSCVSGGGSGTVSSGTINDLAYYTGATTVSSANTLVWDSGNGRLGVGTTSPYAALSVVGSTGVVAAVYVATSTTATTTLAGGLDVGSGGLVYDFSSGITSINNLELGAFNFDTNAGAVSWADMPVTGVASAGTVESYSAQINGTSILTVYSESDGAGGIQYPRVGVNNASPAYGLSVTGTVAFNGLTADTAGSVVVCMDPTTKELYEAAGTTCTGSSIRFKKNVETLSSGLDIVSRLRPVSFDLKKNNESHLGLIAEEVYLVEPRLTFTEQASTTLHGVRYEELTAVLTKAVQELATTTAFISNNYATTSPIFNVDVFGNIGIGTTTPIYALQVVGDVAATSFVNISTRDVKRDINYLNVADGEQILEKIKDMKVATYHYLTESTTNPLRLGLIAEEAPIEVLSATGKGVDVYKLATFILVGVQFQQIKIDALESRVARLEVSGMSGGATSGTSVASVLSSLEQFGARFGFALAQFKRVFVETLTVGSVAKPAGITLYDEVTKAPYCLKVINGIMTSVAGECADLVNDLATTSAAMLNEVGSIGLVDTQPPVIFVNGNNPATVQKGTHYLDLGATITDDVSQNIGYQTSGDQIDTTIPGMYTVMYTAIDAAGNSTTATRTVIVAEDDVASGELTPPANDSQSSTN